MSEIPKLLRVAQAAELLNLSHKTVWAMIYRRDLDVVRIGRSVRIPQKAIDALILRGTVPALKR
jgi:excisionase family DNA binding protein